MAMKDDIGRGCAKAEIVGRRPLVVFAGDDTDFAWNNGISFRLDFTGSTEEDTEKMLSGLSLVKFSLYDYEAEFEGPFTADREYSLSIPKDKTARFPPGRCFAKVEMHDADGRKRTADNRIPVVVTRDSDFAYFAGDGNFVTVVVDNSTAASAADLAAVKEAAETAQKKAEEAFDKANNVEDELGDSVSDLYNKIQGVTGDVNAIKPEVSMLESTVASHGSRISNVETSIGKLGDTYFTKNEAYTLERSIPYRYFNTSGATANLSIGSFNHGRAFLQWVATSSDAFTLNLPNISSASTGIVDLVVAFVLPSSIPDGASFKVVPSSSDAVRIPSDLDSVPLDPGSTVLMTFTGFAKTWLMSWRKFETV